MPYGTDQTLIRTIRGRGLREAAGALRPLTASGAAGPDGGMDQPTGEHHRMRTHSTVNFHTRCLILLDTVRIAVYMVICLPLSL